MKADSPRDRENVIRHSNREAVSPIASTLAMRVSPSLRLAASADVNRLAFAFSTVGLSPTQRPMICHCGFACQVILPSRLSRSSWRVVGDSVGVVLSRIRLRPVKYQSRSCTNGPPSVKEGSEYSKMSSFLSKCSPFVLKFVSR